MTKKHSIEDCRAAIAAWDAAQPSFLACGCPVGKHENSMDAIYEAHPDIIRFKWPDGDGGYRYRVMS